MATHSVHMGMMNCYVNLGRLFYSDVLYSIHCKQNHKSPIVILYSKDNEASMRETPSLGVCKQKSPDHPEHPRSLGYFIQVRYRIHINTMLI